MSTSLLQFAVLLLTIASAAAWITAALRPGKGIVWLIAAGAAFTVFRVVAVAMLWPRGWWFVEEKVLLGLPLSILATLAAVLFALRPASRSRSPAPARTAVFAAALAAAAELLLQLVIGYPLSPWAAAGVVVVVIAGTGLTWLILSRTARRPIAAIGATLTVVILGSVGTAWLADRGDGTLAEYGHQHATEAGEQAPRTPNPATSVAALRTPQDVAGPRIRVELEAQQQHVSLSSGRSVAAWTYGSLPGPSIVATLGDVVEVELRNRDIEAGVTVHWHGYHVPNGEDGAAGVTQDAVLPGTSFGYRFEALQTGTYWYHTHQRASHGVTRGLYGTLVVHPPEGQREDVDLVVPFHTQSGVPLFGEHDDLARHTVEPGETVRLRLINTDQVPRQFVLDGADFRVAALDGADVVGATPVRDESLRVPAGGRYDLVFTMPDSPVRLGSVGARTAGLLFESAPGGTDPGFRESPTVFDPLEYGSRPDYEPRHEPYDVERTVVLDRLPRFHEGVPGYAYTVDGLVFPHIPPTVVREGDTLLLTIVNRGFETHPMHPHGHHVRVVSVDGRAPTGSPLWLDTFDVAPGQVWQVALTANNPGIWMDHCHNLDHAALGMTTHLAYRGIETPFTHGGDTGNAPE